MGSWGYGIRHDDFVCDVIGEFEDVLKAGKNLAEATAAVMSRFSDAIEDADDGPLFWLALADMQWAYGALEPAVLERVRDDFTTGRSLLAWEENRRGFAQRRAVLEKFIRKLEVPKARPARRAKTIVRAPKFRSGECLSIHRFNGEYGAAVVLAADHSIPEHGRNLVGVLDYSSETSPTMEVFLKRQWRLLSHHGAGDRLDVAWYFPTGFRKVKARIAIVGAVEILDSDPKNSSFYFGWGNIGEPPEPRQRNHGV
jgi:hypothetical protein